MHVSISRSIFFLYLHITPITNIYTTFTPRIVPLVPQDVQHFKLNLIIREHTPHHTEFNLFTALPFSPKLYNKTIENSPPISAICLRRSRRFATVHRRV